MRSFKEAFRHVLERLLFLGFFVLQGCYLSHTLEPADAGTDATDAPDARDVGVDTTPDAFDAATDAGCDAGPPTDAGGTPLTLDLLFVVDNSGSMAEEQRALAEQFPVMVRSLATGDLDDDGRPDVQPVGDLRVGVITTNLGAGGFESGAGCRIRDGEGSDGVLRTISRERGCPRDLPPFLGFTPGEAVDEFVEQFACLAVVGDLGAASSNRLWQRSRRCSLPTLRFRS